MARIRTIKPEYWTSEQIVSCSLESRLLFIGMWNFCDDNGIHPKSYKRLKMEVLPGDDCTDQDVKTWIEELITSGLIIEYSIENKGYWQVTGWKNHQKIDKPTYRHPNPHSTSCVLQVAANSSNTRLPLQEDSSSNRPRNGMEGKGMEEYICKVPEETLKKLYLLL